VGSTQSIPKPRDRADDTHSGPASADSTVGVARAAYFRLLNENGGSGDRETFDFP
jgi:hypothetical protein